MRDSVDAQLDDTNVPSAMPSTLTSQPTPIYFYDPPTSVNFRFKPVQENKPLSLYLGSAIAFALVMTFLFVRYCRKKFVSTEDDQMYIVGDDDDDEFVLSDEDLEVYGDDCKDDSLKSEIVDDSGVQLGTLNAGRKNNENEKDVTATKELNPLQSTY